MITPELAQRLARLAPRWQPASGDRFIIPGRNMDDTVFVISEMTIESEEAAGGHIIKFNGTTEWALDSISQDDVLWLPREDQIRAMLSQTFHRLEALEGGYAVVLADGSRHVDIDAEREIGRASCRERV